MEIMHKQQTLKEPCEIPYVTLNEEDEKRLFDLSVQLKFGDFRTVLIATQSLRDCLLHDFPIEVFLQRPDIFKGLLDLLEGNQEGSSATSKAVFTNLAQQALLVMVRRLKNLYRFVGSNVNKASETGSATSRYQSTMQATGQETVNTQPEYIRNSYPTSQEAFWNREEAVQDQKKYGSHHSSDKLSASSMQGAVSCRAALGLILTKSIYMLKDTEKVGLYIQLIKETLQVAEFVFQIEGNREFSEFLHLCLFAFDSVCKFYKEQLLTEVIVQPILPLAAEFLCLLSSIPA